MSAVTTQGKIPRLNYLEGGFQSVAAETQHIKFRGNLSWNIQDFLTCSKFKEDKFQFESPFFELQFGQTVLKFQLNLHLNEKTDDKISVFLNNSNNRDLDIYFAIMALNNTNSPFATFKGSQNFKPSASWGSRQFLSKEKLEKDFKNLLPGGALKLRAGLTVYIKETTTLIKEDRKPNEGSTLADGLAKFCNENSFKDFELKCGDEIFPCHKVILASRSDVFEAMFSQESFAENKNNMSTIEDCNPETLALLLEFIYSDSLKNTSAYNSVDLLLLADRYNVEKLRIECERALAKSIDLSNAANLLSVASRITAPYLLKKVAKFIRSSCSRDLVNSEDWKEMVKTNPQAMNAVFQLGLD